MSEDCSAFISMCLHCLVGKSGHRIPRPIALTLHATRPNEIIHFDFLYIGAGFDGFKYILVVKDDLSSYLWLIPAKCADADTAATEIAKWIRTFTIMRIWVSDQGSHFKNNVMKTLAEDHRIKHNFTVAYSPWVNGTVESCMKHVQAANRCLQSELKLGPQDWPAVTAMIQTALNEAPLRRLGAHDDGSFRTPLEDMTGIKSARTILHATNTHAGNHATKTLTMLRAIQVLEIERLQNVFDQMHKVVAGKVSKNRTRQIQQHNKITNLVAPNFSVRDFVLVRRAQDKGHKQTFRWLGPRRVVKIVGELVYDIENIVTGDVERVHAARLITYRANKENEPVSKELMAHAEHSEAGYELVEDLKDITSNAKDGMWVLVEWCGLPDRKNWTWQHLEELHQGVPDRVEGFLEKIKKREIAQEAKEIL